MAKGNGSTRGSNPRSMYGGGNASVDSGMTPAQFDRYVNELANEEYPTGWSDLDVPSRELALMEAGFTGYADDGAENIMFPTEKDSIVDVAVTAIMNDNYYGPQVNSDTSITIAYKDGTSKTIGSLGSEIDLVSPLSSNQSFKTQENIVRRSLHIGDIAYITHNDSYRETYWIAKGGEERFRRDTDYEYWKKGRGEKRRDYIQDDWI